MGLLRLASKVGNTFRRSIKSFDLFPHDIKLTYKGKNSFTTMFGGIMSLMIIMLCAVYGTSLFITMIFRQDSNTSTSMEYRNLNEYDSNIYPYQKGFRIAVALTDITSTPIPLNPSLFTLEFEQASVVYTGGAVSVTYTDLEYEL